MNWVFCLLIFTVSLALTAPYAYGGSGRVGDGAPTGGMDLSRPTTTEPNTSVLSRVVEKEIFGQTPVLVSRPGEVTGRTRLIVLLHGFGPPQSPQALLKVMNLARLDAVLAFVNMPLVSERLPPGGTRELMRIQADDFVNGFFFKSISSFADRDLRDVVDGMTEKYHLPRDQGIGLFGFSAGGAAALLALLESDVPVRAAVIVNAPMSVAQNVGNWERVLKKHFEWDEASRQAATRYDVLNQAEQISRRSSPALLIMQGDKDEQFDVETAQKVYEALKIEYKKQGVADQIGFIVVHGLAHTYGPSDLVSPSDTTRVAEKIETQTSVWFERFLAAPP